MKFCSQCGAANEDEMYSCYSCGAPLEADTSYTGQKRSFGIPKPVLAIAGIVLAVGLIVGGIILAISALGGKMDDALDQTLKEFTGDKEEPTQFQRFFEVANQRLEEGDYSMNARFSNGQVDLSFSTDYSRSGKQLRGEMNFDGFDMEFSASKKIVQIRFPGEYEVYGFNVDDINKITEMINDMLNIPFVGNLLPSALPTDLKLDLFAKNNLAGLLEGIAGEEYQAFLDSVKVEDWNDETLAVNGRNVECRVYKVSWKSEALTDLLGALGSGGFLPNVGGLVNALLPEIEPYVYCYVNDEDYLVGARFTAAGTKCLFQLEGEENLWDEFSITAETMSGEVRVYEGARIMNGEAMELYLKDPGGQMMISVAYDDASGDFSLTTATYGTLLTGQVTGKVGEAGIRLNWELPETGHQELVWSITRLRQQPEQLGEKYSDLMTMAWSVLENILNDWLTNR